MPFCSSVRAHRRPVGPAPAFRVHGADQTIVQAIEVRFLTMSIGTDADASIRIGVRAVLPVQIYLPAGRPTACVWICRPERRMSCRFELKMGYPQRCMLYGHAPRVKSIRVVKEMEAKQRLSEAIVRLLITHRRSMPALTPVVPSHDARAGRRDASHSSGNPLDAT